MKRYTVILFSLLMLATCCLCALGESSFYTKYVDNYLVLLPDGKTNKNLASTLGGTVYTDSSFSIKANDSIVAGTGRFIDVSDKKYEIVVLGDYDGDGLILNPDIDKARGMIGESLSKHDILVFDADENGNYTAKDYLMLKFHQLGIKKLVEPYEESTQTESSDSPSKDASDDTSVDPDWVNQCSVSLSDEKININGSGASVSGKTVTITQGGEYTVSGKITDGMIQVNSTAKVKIRLSNVNISNSKGPAILFANADKAYITVANGTTNYLSDGSSYSNGKGTIFSETDLEIKGKGTLYITANYKHGICCDNDLAIENGIINIQSAVKDGIHAKKSIEISGGTISIKNCEGDAIDCEGNSSGQKGTVSITDGKINIENTSGDGINALGNIALSGGNISISCAEDGIKTDAYAYISGNVSITIDAGSDGVNSVKGINVSSGDVKINATEYTLKSDANVSVTGGSLILEDCQEKIYALGNVNIANGTIK